MQRGSILSSAGYKKCGNTIILHIAVGLAIWRIMNSLNLTDKDGHYVAKGSADSKPLSNCTLRLLRPVMAGDRSGYIGGATHTNGSTKVSFIVHL